ncbi:hypothetical protein BGX27_001190 [Mortierella sp. AM989]|nr:hypothetical protein BGX27_001190 [Mortierella sp. AM989]
MPFIQPTGCNLHSRSSIINTKDTEANSLQMSTKKSKSETGLSCQVKNNWVKSADDSIHIFTKTWKPAGTATAESVIVYDKLLKEIDSAIERASVAHPNRPLFLMGHGMGGALVLNYVCGLGKKITSLAGVISSSPYLKPTLASAGARFPATYNRLGKWYPNIGISFPVAPQELTRDHAEQERYQGDGLIRDSVSLQCLGDMIYQGNKVLIKRWKMFPVQLPALLLHGTDDPICSYQATAALSNQLLKLQPHNFKFKSWKGHKHDPPLAHWDIDASTVKSEYIHWICTSSRHFEMAPLEACMVHSDSIKSARIGKSKKDQDAEKRREMEAKKKEKQDKKQSKLDKAKPKQEEQTKNPSSPAAVSSAVSKQVKEPAEPEQPINDLKGLLRQQQLKLEKAEEKRREYGQSTAQDSREAPTTSSIALISASNGNTTHSEGSELKQEERGPRIEKEGVNIAEAGKEQMHNLQHASEPTQTSSDVISDQTRDVEESEKEDEMKRVKKEESEENEEKGMAENKKEAKEEEKEAEKEGEKEEERNVEKDEEKEMKEENAAVEPTEDAGEQEQLDYTHQDAASTNLDLQDNSDYKSVTEPCPAVIIPEHGETTVELCESGIEANLNADAISVKATTPITMSASAQELAEDISQHIITSVQTEDAPSLDAETTPDVVENAKEAPLEL